MEVQFEFLLFFHAIQSYSYFLSVNSAHCFSYFSIRLLVSLLLISKQSSWKTEVFAFCLWYEVTVLPPSFLFVLSWDFTVWGKIYYIFTESTKMCIYPQNFWYWAKAVFLNLASLPGGHVQPLFWTKPTVIRHRLSLQGLDLISFQQSKNLKYVKSHLSVVFFSVFHGSPF